MPVIIHPDVRRKLEDYADKQRWIEAMADDDDGSTADADGFTAPNPPPF